MPNPAKPKPDEPQPSGSGSQPRKGREKPRGRAEEEDNDSPQSKRSLEFSTENYKLELYNLPLRVKYHTIRHLLEGRFKVSAHKIRMGNQRAFLAFRSEEARDIAIKLLDNQIWRGLPIRAKVAEPIEDPFQKKLKPDYTPPKEEKGEVSEDDINDKVCCLWKQPYEKQLESKEKFLKGVLNMSRQIKKLSPNLEKDDIRLYYWVQRHEEICCEFDGVKPSPRLIGYRNKCEFNIGTDGTIGFRMGRYKDGIEKVYKPPYSCPIVNKTMFFMLDLFQTYIKDETNTKLRGYDNVSHEGHLRQISIRTNEREECLVLIDIHPQDLSDADLAIEGRGFINLFKYCKQVVSIYLNISKKNHLTDASDSLKLIFGQGYLIEYLDVYGDVPLKFRIGPISFFQVNTKAAEILYKSIIEMAGLNSSSFVLDVGCGTGTIGLTLAKTVSFVVGIDISPDAILDAKANAKENKLSNTAFFSGRAEDLISESISILKAKLDEKDNKGEIVAIVDPPRSGFNNAFIKSLRASKIKKVIYVACDPKANTNLISLCRPTSKAYPQDPFVPTRASAVDLFPHTNFCELVLLYERLSMVKGMVGLEKELSAHSSAGTSAKTP